MNTQAIFESVIRDARPSTLLVTGGAAEAAARGWQSSASDVRIHVLDTGQGELAGPGAEPHDLALVADTLESMDRTTGTQLLGQLRNLGNRQIAVLVSNTSEWRLTDLVALGFTRQAGGDGRSSHSLYTYNIDTYNHKRDWNNPKYWANPEMWDKARW
ncbi:MULTISPECIES: DUF6231 family protein [Marinobacter]|uniref:Uncharacterized protein n=1 Tax=Marinobacter segnicrescens TaxID=430453 RepID=A0A1I0A651_9GAMM|nr:MULTISPECIES: DUF6231 family protein [Marinobacter]UZD66139.1 DUF6231 family protein [Marinobacter sp. AN1]SES88692.1 hypothetical protein SAMN04487962_102191 [Marinobacter segnicrescens]